MPYVTSSGKHCAVFGCSNNRRKIYLWKNSVCEMHKPLLKMDCACLIPYSLHRIPQDKELKLKWVKAINRKGYIPTGNTYVCSIHFEEGSSSNKHKIPTLHLGYDNTKVVKPRRALKRKASLPINSDHKEKHLSLERERIESISSNKPVVEEFITSKASSELFEPTCSYEPMGSSNSIKEEIPVFVRLENKTKEVGTQYYMHEDHSYIKKECRSGMFSVGVQTDFPNFDSELLNNHDCKFYTGLNLGMFFKLVTLMSAYESNVKMSLPNQLLLVLIRLRLGLLFADLARRFSISTNLASNIFNFWIRKMAIVLKPLVYWLPRDSIQYNMPQEFEEKFPNTTAILDCTEVFIDRSRAHITKALTYSNYTHKNTAKFLKAISPNGLIMFVSERYGGRASNKFITNDCGILDNVLPGDEWMCDRGFKIEEELMERYALLNIPAFTRGKKQLSAEEVHQTRKKASARIHVERIIGKWKKYRIFKQLLPVTSLKVLDDMALVCAALCNLQSPIVEQPQ